MHWTLLDGIIAQRRVKRQLNSNHIKHQEGNLHTQNRHDCVAWFISDGRTGVSDSLLRPRQNDGVPGDLMPSFFLSGYDQVPFLLQRKSCLHDCLLTATLVPLQVSYAIEDFPPKLFY